VCVCVCMREREREGGGWRGWIFFILHFTLDFFFSITEGTDWLSKCVLFFVET